MSGFPWDGNELVTSIYELENGNCAIHNYNVSSDICLIFFSSNGIYFPNTPEEFAKRIVTENRFEWTKIASSKRVHRHAGKIIYVRDIFKQWYVTGINAHVNTVDGLVEFLREETKGYRVITVGSSAGGYAATLVGLKLGAEACFSFSGQFCIHAPFECGPLLEKYAEDKNTNRYYDLCCLLAENELRSKITPVYYFYPGKCMNDIEQCRLVRHYHAIRAFSFDQKHHGSTMLPCNMPYVITMDASVLDGLHGVCVNRNISRLRFLFQSTGPKMALRELFKLLYSLLVKKTRVWSSKALLSRR